MTHFDPQVGRARRPVSASETRRSTQNLLRHAATLALFATGVAHQTQTVRAAAYTLTSANSYTYTENFDGIASGLTTGWGTYSYTSSTAAASSIGTAVSPVLTATAWSITTGQFKNVAAIDTTSTSATTAVQSSATDRALGLQATAAFGDTAPAAFAFNFTSTGMKFAGGSTALSLKMMLDSLQTRSQTYTIQYATGASPTTFIDLGTWADPGVLGSTTITFTGDQLSALSNQSAAWIRILSGPSTGSGSRDGVALDDFILTYSAFTVTGNYWVGGSGTWTSTSANFATTSAGTTAGTAATTGSLVFETASAAVTVSGTTSAVAGLSFTADGISISGGTIALGANQSSMAVSASNTATISSSLTGTNGLMKSGNGTLILSGANTYTGGTIISSGTIKVGGSTALGSSASAVSVSSGAVLDLNGKNLTNANALTLNGSGISNAGALINTSTTNVIYGGLVSLGSDATINATSGNITFTNSGTIAGSGYTLTIDGSSNTRIDSNIGTGTGGLNKTGAGTLTLNGTNTYTGATALSGGSLSAQAGALGGSVSMTITNGASLTAFNLKSGVNISVDATSTATITGSGQTVGTFDNANTSAAAVNFSNSTGTVTITTLAGAGNTNFGSNLSVSGGTTSGSITGTGSLTKTSASTLTLSGTNTWTGGTSLNAGKIILSNGSLSGGTISIANAATLAAVGTSSASSLSLVGGSILDLTSAGLSLTGGLTATGGELNYTLGNTLAVAGALTLSGTVNISLAGNFEAKRYDLLTFASGLTTDLNITTSRLGWKVTPVVTGTKYSIDISADSSNLTWNLAGDGNWDKATAANWYNSSLTTTQAFADGDSVTFNNSAGGLITISGTVIPSGVTVNSSGDYTFQSGTIAGDGGITKSGNGKLTLAAANTFAGQVLLNGGTLSVTDANALGATSSGTTVATGATLSVSENITLVAEPLTIAGSGVGGVGALTSLGGANTISGSITLSASALITSQGLSGTDSLTLSGSLSGSNATLSIGGSADTTVSGNISGSGLALTKTGNGILTLSGTNNYTGGTTISGGKVIAATANLTGNIVDNGILEINQPTTATFSGNISGSGELIKEGLGILTLSGTNTFSTLTINTGTLIVSSPLALPSTGTVSVNGDSLLTLSTAGTYGSSNQTLTLLPTNSLSQALSTGSGVAVTLASNLVIGSQSQIAVPGASGVLTLSGVLSGSGKLFKTDLGKIIISGTNNNFLGSTEIQNGTLTINAGSTFGTGTLTMNGVGGVATLELNESATVASLISGRSASANSIITIATGKTLTVNEGGTNTFGTLSGSNTSIITGAGGLTMSGSGELTLAEANSYTGLTSVTAGTLVATKAASISATASVSSGAILSLQDNQTLTSLAGAGNVQIADGKTFTLNNSSTNNFSGSFTGAGATTFTKSDSGTLNLSGASSNLSRDLTLGAGTIKASNNTALGTGAVLIGTGGTGSAGTLYVADGKTVSNNITIGSLASSGLGTKSLMAGWDFSTNTSVSLAASTSGSTLTVGNLVKGSGLTGTVSTLSYFGPFTNWNAGTTATDLTYAETNNKYFGFSITATTNNLALTDIIAYKTRRSTTGPTSLTWEYSIGSGSFTQIGSYSTGSNSSSGQAAAAIDLTSVYTLQNISAGSTINFRVYGTGSTGSGGTFYLMDLGNTTGTDFGVNGQLYLSTPVSGSGTIGIDEVGTATFTGNITNNNQATLTAVTGGTAIFKTGVISGTGAITKTGNGTVELQGANTFTGPLTLSAGNLRVATLGAGGSASPLGAAPDAVANLVFTGGKLEYVGSGETLTRDFTVGNGGAGFISSGTGALVIGTGAQMDFDNASASNRTLSLGGTSDIAVENIFNPTKIDANDVNNLFTKLVKQDVNKWIVLGTGAGFWEDVATEINVDAGELDFGTGSLGSSSNQAHINVGSATLGWVNGNTDDLSGRIYLNSAATAVFNIPSGTVTLENSINSTGAASTASLTKQGAGTLELGAINNFSGGMTIAGGTVRATATGALGSGAVNISNNATLVVNTVLANKINVTSGSTLAGNGTDDDATIEEGGILSPNGDSVGLLSFNKLTLNGGAHVKWQLQNATGLAGVGYDSLVVSVINLSNATSSKKIRVDVSGTNVLNFDKTKTQRFEFAKLSTALGGSVNVTDLFSIDASLFELANNLTNDHLVWSMQLSADRDMMYVTTMIPEPSTYGLGLSALALAVVAIRRRKKIKAKV